MTNDDLQMFEVVPIVSFRVSERRERSAAAEGNLSIVGTKGDFPKGIPLYSTSSQPPIGG